jgi:hypothetical protein
MLLVACAVSLGLLLKLQMAGPMGGGQPSVTGPDQAPATGTDQAPLAENTPAVAPELSPPTQPSAQPPPLAPVGPPTTTSPAGVLPAGPSEPLRATQPPVRPKPAQPQTLTLEAWVEGGKLRLKCNAAQQVQFYTLGPQGKTLTGSLQPGREGSFPLSAAAARQLAGKTASVTVSDQGGKLRIGAQPRGLVLFVNRNKWPNKNYVAGKPTRIGFNFPGSRPVIGVVITGASLAAQSGR